MPPGGHPTRAFGLPRPIASVPSPAQSCSTHASLTTATSSCGTDPVRPMKP